MIDIDELMRKQNLCEHRNVIEVDAVVIDHYFQCQDCLKISTLSTYFEHYLWVLAPIAGNNGKTFHNTQ